MQNNFIHASRDSHFASLQKGWSLWSCISSFVVSFSKLKSDKRLKVMKMFLLQLSSFRVFTVFSRKALRNEAYKSVGTK